MKSDFYTVMLRRDDLLHRRAIWQEVLEHLKKFVDTDAVPAAIGIRTEGSGMVVPQDKIGLVVDEIENGYMSDIDVELAKIHKSEVAEDGGQKRKKKEPSKKEGKKTKRVAGKRKSTRSK